MTTSSGAGPSPGYPADSRWHRRQRPPAVAADVGRDDYRCVTTTQNPPTEQPKTASDAGARPYATVNPYTGKKEQEFPFLESGDIDGVVERAHAAFQEWRKLSTEERAAIVGRAAELMNERRDEYAAL